MIVLIFIGLGLTKKRILNMHIDFEFTNWVILTNACYCTYIPLKLYFLLFILLQPGMVLCRYFSIIGTLTCPPPPKKKKKKKKLVDYYTNL